MADSDGSHGNGSSAGPDEGDVPTSGEVVPDRFSSDEVFQRIVANADHEITSGTRELFFSALAGGFAITITLLAYASVYPKTDSVVLSVILYPLGFLYIIIGGYQLYTENTLPPVALTLERLASIPALLRVWGIVAAGNFAGGALGAVVLAYGGVFEPEAAAMAAEFARHGVETSKTSLFFKGAFAGLVVAGVVWVEYAARDTISRVVMVYLAFLTIPLADLFHVVVSFTEVVYLVLVGNLSFVVGMTEFVIPVFLGNTIGGVVLVTIVNYYQTSERRLESARFENVRRLSTREWLLGGLAGRTYVPVVDTVGEFVRDPESYHVLVPIANPRTETKIVKLACSIASAHESGSVHVVHVVQTPQQSGVEGDGLDSDRIVRTSNELLNDARRVGKTYDVDFETSTIVTPWSLEEIFDRAHRTRPDLVVMGWGRDQVWSAARAERPLDELTNRIPCDFLIAKDRGLQCERLLLPTAGGPDSDLSAEVANALQETVGAEVTLLHVVESPAEREGGERFIREWGEERGLEDATFVVDDSGDVEGAIKRAAADCSTLLIGATERGLLSRLIYDSLHMNVVDEVECSVLLAERASERTFTERLFGRGRREKTPDEVAEPQRE